MSTNDLLSPATWRALAGEYLPYDQGRKGAQANAYGRDHGTAQAWYELLDHVEAHTSLRTTGDVTLVRSHQWTPDHEWTLRWHAREDADDLITSFGALDAWARHYMGTAGPIPLSSLHCDHPIFKLDDNLRFRAWHDTGHLAYGLDFTANQELRLFGRQARELLEAERYMGVDALFCESVYQLAAAVHLGTFPDRQYCRKLGPVGRAVRDLLVGLS